MRVDELEGTELDYWVAKAEGHEIDLSFGRTWDDKKLAVFIGHELTDWAPSTDWSQGGPIIERENIQLSPPTSPVHRCGGPNAGAGQSGVWSACTWHRGADGRRAIGHDEKSPLAAAMRCFVRLKFGDEVNPE